MAEMVQASHRLTVQTRGKGFIEITRELARWLELIAGENGLLTVFVCHTSASLVIQSLGSVGRCFAASKGSSAPSE